MLAEHPGKKILVFGDMLEIGPQSPEFHRQIGAYANQHHVDYFVTFGSEAKYAAEAFGTSALHFTDYKKLLAAIKPLLDQGSMIVVKGSHGMKMDRIVNGLLDMA